MVSNLVTGVVVGFTTGIMLWFIPWLTRQFLHGFKNLTR